MACATINIDNSNHYFFLGFNVFTYSFPFNYRAMKVIFYRMGVVLQMILVENYWWFFINKVSD